MRRKVAHMSRGRVLIVEDESIVRLHLSRVVEQIGYTVVATASCADEAVQAAIAHAPDLVLMDIQLAGDRDGVDAAAEIRSRCEAAIVFLTAFADEKTVQRTQAAGASGYIVKPFRDVELRAAMATAASTRSRLSDSERRVESLTSALSRVEPRAHASGESRGGDANGGRRILMYSHDTLGLGHLRRCLNLAGATTSRFEDASVLVVTGSPVAQQMTLPTRVDTVKLPAVKKVAPETYAARAISVPDDSVASLRAGLILRSVQEFEPHVVLVDHSPAGMAGELRPSLEWLKQNRPQCARILGLRDIIDDPHAVVTAWSGTGVYDLIDAHYDHIVVYGTRRVFDPISSYRFPDRVAQRVQFLNYVTEQSVAFDPGQRAPSDPPRVLATIGGGDGAGDLVIGTLLEVMRRDNRAFVLTVLPGPLADPGLVREVREMGGEYPVSCVEYAESSSAFMAKSDLVVCTGGYNTMVQAVRNAQRTLVIPRLMHRNEQILRARAFAKMGLVEYMTPEAVTAERLLETITRLMAEPSRTSEKNTVLDCDGADRFADFLEGRVFVTANAVEPTAEQE